MLRRVFTILIVSLFLQSFQITDVEIEMKLNDNQKSVKRYTINAGKDYSFVKEGSNFAVLKSSIEGKSSVSAMLEAYSVGKEVSYARLKQLSPNVSETSLGVGDAVFPVISVDRSRLFKDKNSSSLSKDGKDFLKDIAKAMTNEENFKLLKLFFNSQNSEQASDQQLATIKDYLSRNHPEIGNSIEILNNVDLNSIDGKSRDETFDFIYISDENDKTLPSITRESKVFNREKRQLRDIKKRVKDRKIPENRKKIGREIKKKKFTSFKNLKREKKVYKKGATISLPIINFATGSFEIPKTDFERLDSLKYIFMDNPGIEIEIRGFADQRGGEKYNLELSKKRADSVKEYLITRLKVDPKKVTTIGMGEVKSVSTDEDVMKDFRRIEFKVVKAGYRRGGFKKP